MSAPLAAFASEDAARFVLALSSNCPLWSSLSPVLFSTTKRNFSPLLRISILPAIIALLVVLEGRVYGGRLLDAEDEARVEFAPRRRGTRLAEWLVADPGAGR